MSSTERLLLFLWLPCLIVGGWEISARRGFVDPLFFPAPTAILAAGVRLAASGELAMHLAATLTRLIVAFAVATVAGLTCGLSMGLWPRVNRSLEPLISALYTTPKISLLPLLFVLFGIGDTARTMLVAASAFIIVTLHAFDAVSGVNRAFVELARNYGARGFQMVRRVYLPSAFPGIFTGLRLAFGRSLTMTITVEVVSGRDGIGSMIWIAGQTLATEKLFLGVLITGCLGGLSHAMMRRIEKVALPWRVRHAG
jgi:NitT/TauT family transport system permease protein